LQIEQNGPVKFRAMFIGIMKKIILGFILGLIVGSLSVYLLNSAPVKETADSTKAFSSAAQNLKLELNDYVRLESSDEKLRRAEEILGKVMILFLANIAIHFEPETIDYFDAPKSIEVAVKAPLPSNTIEIETPPKENPPTISKLNYIDSELSMDNLPRHFEGKLGFLSKSTLKEPFKYFSSAKAINSAAIYNKVSGLFKGDLYILRGKMKGFVDQVILDIDFQVEPEKLKGTYELSLSRDGVPYSVNRGRGNNRQVKTLDSKNGEILLEASPSSFLQVYPVGDSELFGNFYDNGKFLGIVRLVRN
jgi:hypothetical protein